MAQKLSSEFDYSVWEIVSLTFNCLYGSGCSILLGKSALCCCPAESSQSVVGHVIKVVQSIARARLLISKRLGKGELKKKTEIGESDNIDEIKYTGKYFLCTKKQLSENIFAFSRHLGPFPVQASPNLRNYRWGSYFETSFLYLVIIVWW